MTCAPKSFTIKDQSALNKIFQTPTGRVGKEIEAEYCRQELGFKNPQYHGSSPQFWCHYEADTTQTQKQKT